MTMSRQNLTMRKQLTAQLKGSIRAQPTTRDDRHDDEPVPEPTLHDRLRAVAPGLDPEALDALVESERVRVRDGVVEVATLAGWMPASLSWAARQAASIAPRRPAPSRATHETVASQLVDRRRPRKPDNHNG